MVARLLLASASLHVDENEAHDWFVGFGDVSTALYHAKIEELVCIHVSTWVLLDAQQSYEWYLRCFRSMDDSRQKKTARSSEGQWSSRTCWNASRSSAWPEARGFRRLARKTREQPPWTRGQVGGSEVEELSQFGRPSDSVRDDDGDVRHVQANDRSNGKADAGDTLLH